MNWLEKHITLQIFDDKRAEKENAYTHFFGALLSIIGFGLILIKLPCAKSTALQVGLIIFALTNILLYSASGLYHYLPPSNAKRVCRILDHSNIYFLIAGTYTPILMYAGTQKALFMTALMWLIALSGVAFTLIFWGKLKPLHPILYILMGWMIVFFWNDIIPFIPRELILYLVGGGITYTVGVLFYAMKKLPHYHAIWHLFVLAGSLWFYVGIYRTLL